MLKVKQYLKELEAFVRVEQDRIKELEDAGIYNEGMIAQERKDSHDRIQKKQAEYKDMIDQHIDNKISAVIKANTYSSDILDPGYQTYQSNVLTKVQLLGDELSVEMLQGMIQPIVDKKDTLTLEAIRASLQKKTMKNDETKKKLLSCIPRSDNKVELLKNAKSTIDHLIDGDAFEHAKMSGVIGLKYLEQSGVFNIS